MSDRKTNRYILSTMNGIDIELIGDRNMRNLTSMLSDYDLKVRFIAPKSSERKVHEQSPELIAVVAGAKAREIGNVAREALDTIRSLNRNPKPADLKKE